MRKREDGTERERHKRPPMIRTKKENDRAQRERELRGSSVPGRERGGSREFGRGRETRKQRVNM